ncbi:MAG: cysteinyl-tRNA synthetase, cysteinyl-tRNA synthetase [Candidatus Adlerbacteria bacterium GW2011_GWC1_50_9]|uniref:Cysteine--tRNA ligase n=1 Tax=Candidatus Adlerbacteria bacterium GW2011_GWC1_50_9 TaxID=1618608 RepID=A0A0G1WR90_9BACT|nr:MAG: cysteinyl-tRNA synthetase, cysteinyl-tRNA synthetase [Candidatus Adlerbacteria bacterium GW2011_GWC1_50_9]
MPLRLFNMLTRKKEVFKPARGKTARFYACGPTVYDYVHIGNLRTFIFEDVLHRALALNGYKVKMVMNITDIDDKTIRGAKKAGKALKEFTDFYAKEFFKDIKKLNILPAAKYPRATRHFGEMKKIIRILLKKKYAYETGDGIYFDISRFKKYGRLSGLKKRELKIGARIQADEYSKDEPSDFALWKKKGPPAGGRPGWHLECSAMSIKYLGLPIDVHAGGVDLIFPHHENEIAQSEAAFGKKFARFFVEGEHLKVEGKKMSKSLGNLLTFRDLERKGFDPLDFRYLTLTAHYRSPLSFSWKSLEAAQRARRNLMSRSNADGRGLEKFQDKFLSRLNDDLDTPGALALLHQTSGRGPLLFSDLVFGLGLAHPPRAPKIPAEIKKLLGRREEARAKKNWSGADKIREEIRKLGFSIEDSPAGPKVKHTLS